MRPLHVVTMILCVAALSSTSMPVVMADPSKSAPARLLLIGRPEIESPSITGIDIVNGAIERGTKEAIEHGTILPGESRYDRVVSIREIEEEDTKFISPLEKYEIYSENRLKAAIRRKYSLHRLPIPKGLLQPILYRSPAGDLVVELELWKLPEWERLQTKRVGGCGASVQEVAEAARDAAAKLSRDAAPGGAIEPIANLLSDKPLDDGSYNVLAGRQVTLDSCSTLAPDHDAFLVKWTQPECASQPQCVLPRDSMRPRQTVDLASPGIYTFKLTILTSTDDSKNRTKTITVTALESPKATVIVREGAEILDNNTRRPMTGEDPRRPPSAAEYQRAAAAFYASMDDEQLSSLRTVRVERNKSKRVYLDANGSRPSLPASEHQATGSIKYYWEQLEGTSDTFSRDGPMASFTASWSNPGTYVFRLTVENRGHKDSQKISVLVAPKIFADAGPEETVDVGERLHLDHGSYDVLDESPLFSWAVEGTGARILDPVARTPTFIAEQPGNYAVRVFVRARRTQGDRKLWDVATTTKIVHVSDGRHSITGLMSGNYETRNPVAQLPRHFGGFGGEYMYRSYPLVVRARVRVGWGREFDQWRFKTGIADIHLGVVIGRPAATSFYMFAGVSGIPRDPFQIGPAVGAKVMRRLVDKLSLSFDVSGGILFVGDDRPFVGSDLGLALSFK